MVQKVNKKQIKILLVEDNPGDIRLTQEVFKDSAFDVSIEVCYDGEEALLYLKDKSTADKEAYLPDIIILDLNLPKKNGLELLKDIKNNSDMVHLPVIMLTSSEAQNDILSVYRERANCYLTKPVDYDEFCRAINMIENFWFDIASLPKSKNLG
ncbi:MAG: response regulator [Chitinophagales bacterium]